MPIGDRRQSVINLRQNVSTTSLVSARPDGWPLDRAPYYQSRTEDRLWYWLYVPVARVAERLSGWIGVLQRGRIHIYLIYSFATLILLLVFAR